MSTHDQHQDHTESPNIGHSAVNEVPDGVKNVEAYKKWLKLKDSPTISLPDRLIYTSDVNVVIDPAAAMPAIHKRLTPLGGDEIDEILQKVKAVKVVLSKVGSLKHKAFGISINARHRSLAMGVLDERSSELIQYFGQLLTTTEVHKIITREWGYEVSIATLRKFKARNTEAIEQAKDQFYKDYSGIRLSHKKGRLLELQDIFIKRKMRWDESHSQADEKLMLQTLRQIREETHDPTLRINANINSNINVTIQNHIEREVMKGLTINDIIIARVAARMNVNPTFLITRLHNSLYAKHSGFKRPDDDLQDQDITYPSQMVYNWSQIAEQHEKHGDANIEEAEWEDVSDDDKNHGSTLKDMLLEKIKQKKQDVSQAQNRINNHKDDSKM